MEKKDIRKSKLKVEIFPNVLCVDVGYLDVIKNKCGNEYNDSTSYSMYEVLESIPPEDLISFQLFPNSDNTINIVIIWKIPIS